MTPPIERILPDLLRDRADGSRTAAYHFYAAGTCDATTVSYAELHQDARRIAAALLCHEAGERAVIAMPPGRGFLRAFFATLYAGLVAVPLPPFGAVEQSASRRRALDLVRDADPRVVFLPVGQHGRVASMLRGVRLYDTDALDEFAGSGDERPVAPDSPALLQYSSGTGGRPKGVVLSHRAVIANLESIREAFGHTTASRGVIWLPPFHDMGLVGGILQPLYAGFPVCLMTPETFARRPLRWLEAISTFGATTSGGPCTAYEACIRSYRNGKHNDLVRGLDLSSWEVAFVGAEPIHADTLKRFEDLFGPHGFRSESFVPCYGLAENTLLATAHRRGSAWAHAGAERARSCVSCGWTSSPTELVIVDPETHVALPDGNTGEIWIRGPSVGIGYWNQPEATTRTFAASRAARPDERFLRTGDLGFVDRRQLFVTGRLKNLIIVNGQNYEPEMLEKTILESDAGECVLSSLVFATDEQPSRIVVLVEVDHRGPPATLAAIESRVRAILAQDFDLAIGAFELLRRGTLERTSSGKLRRRENESAYHRGTLDLLDVGRAAGASEPGVLGRALTELLSSELDVDRDTVRNARSFAALGLDSLKAIGLQERIASELAVEVSLQDLLAGGGFEALIRHARPASRVAVATLEDEPTRTQRSIWFAHQLDPGVAAFNLGCSVRFDYTPRTEAVTEAFRRVLAAHPELRARYVTRGGSLVREVTKDVRPRVEELDAEVVDYRRRPFDLETPPLMRVAVAASDAGSLLHIVVHHIAADYASMAILVRQMCESVEALAAGEEPRLPPPRLRSFVPEPVDRSSREATAPIELTRLPTDRPRGSWKWSAATRERILDEALMTSLGDTARDLGVTRHALFMALLMELLHRYTGERNISIASPVSTRAVEARRDVGCFVSLAPVCIRFEGGSTLADVADRITGQIARAIDYRKGAPLTTDDPPPPMPVSDQPPACPVVFAHYPEIAQGGPDRSWRVESEHDASAIFELLFGLSRCEGRTRLSLTYAADLFEPESIDGILDCLLAMVAAAVRNPHAPVRELGLEGVALSETTTPALDAPFSPVGSRFRSQARLTPERVAVTRDREHVSYAAVLREVDEVAWRLRELGVGRETVVGICLPRHAHLVATVLAVLDLGATFLPLDPNLPPHRLRWMAEDAGADFVINEGSPGGVFESDDSRLVSAYGEAAPVGVSQRRQDIHPEQLACILYTSGSTGTPKGVALRHAGISELMAWAASFFPSARTECVLASSSLGFDLSLFEILATLCHGGTVVLADTIGDLTSLAARHAVTLVNTVPSAMKAVLPSLPHSVSTVNLGGEPLSTALLRDLFRTGHVTRVVNLYGPCEDTTYSTERTYREYDEVISIGSPLPGETAIICTERSRIVAAGMTGELCLAGPGLARGYVNRPAATASSFLPNPYARNPGERLYRTGDRVRLSARGDLRIHGRLDRQIKLRGFRIEPSEIEHVMGEVDGVVASAVVLDDRAPEQRELAAFVVGREPRTARRALAGEVRTRLLDRLPHYMVPRRLVVVPELPVTNNGKLDREALLHHLRTEGSVAPAAPRSALEGEILAYWERCLPMARVGIHDNLFQLGADSLLVLRFVSEVLDRQGVAISVKDAFGSPSVASIAELIDERRTLRDEPPDALVEQVESLSDEEAQRMLDVLENEHQ